MQDMKKTIELFQPIYINKKYLCKYDIIYWQENIIESFCLQEKF